MNEQHELLLKPRMKSCPPEGYADH